VKMFFKYKKWVKIVKDSSLGITEFHFLNKDGEEIDVAQKEKITPNRWPTSRHRLSKEKATANTSTNTGSTPQRVKTTKRRNTTTTVRIPVNAARSPSSGTIKTAGTTDAIRTGVAIISNVTSATIVSRVKARARPHNRVKAKSKTTKRSRTIIATRASAGMATDVSMATAGSTAKSDTAIIVINRISKKRTISSRPANNATATFNKSLKKMNPRQLNRSLSRNKS